jgi:hypothetical protein
MPTDSDGLLAALFSSDARAPYYLVCPPYKRASAGVTVMHRLCHLLNMSGYPSFVVVDRRLLGRYGYSTFPTSSGLVTPELTREVAQQHFEAGVTPVVVYPETVKGNPLRAPYVCRYLLSYPGLLGGSTTLDREESVFSYSRAIARRTHSQENVLFLPVSDPEFFVPPTETHDVRRGAYRYNQKFVHVHGGKVPAELLPYPEITRDQVDSHSPEELRSIFQRIERLYVFENSALSIEAALCGCVVVLVPNEWFSEVIAIHELGTAGMAWGNVPEEIARAQSTIPLFRLNYLQALSDVPSSLARFIQETQRGAHGVAYEERIDLSFVSMTVGREQRVNWMSARSLARVTQPVNGAFRPMGIRRASIALILRGLQAVGLYDEARWLYRRVRRWGISSQLRPRVMRNQRLSSVRRRITRRPPGLSRGELPPHVL